MGKPKIIQTINPKKKWRSEKAIYNEVENSRTGKRLGRLQDHMYKLANENPGVNVFAMLPRKNMIHTLRKERQDMFKKALVQRNQQLSASEINQDVGSYRMVGDWKIPDRIKPPHRVNLAKARKEFGPEIDDANARDIRFWNKQAAKVQEKLKQKEEGISYQQPELQDAPDPDIVKFKRMRTNVKKTLRDAFDRNDDFTTLKFEAQKKIYQNEIIDNVISYLEPSSGIGQLTRAKIAVRGGLQGLGPNSERSFPNIAELVASYAPRNQKSKDFVNSNGRKDSEYQGPAFDNKNEIWF